MRAKIMIISTGKEFHFTEGKLQRGDIWFPIKNDTSLFEAVEEIMTINNIAHNVTRLELERDLGNCKDYTVVYNKAV
jgi:hypothetical protein